jgi:penicillin-binding protein 1A
MGHGQGGRATADLAAGAWFGNDDGRAMRGVTGGSLPAALWGRIMRRALAEVPAQPLPLPEPGADGEREPEGFIERILRSLTDGGTPERPPPESRRPFPER